jgi:GH24 family phage-related lysozyme (muramidase)
MALDFVEVKVHMVPYEGNISHMYLDTKGLVTVGIGNLLASVEAAQALEFVSRASTRSASAAEIKTDYESIQTQKVGLRAQGYREFTKLDLPDVAINDLFRKRIDEFKKQLKASYPSFDDYPPAAQLAMLDMAFNLGTSGLRRKWPNLNAAIDKKDWADAAANCTRPDANAVRNTKTIVLFKRAAEQAAADLKK